MSETSHGPARSPLRGLARAADLLLPLVAVTLRRLPQGPEHRRTLARGWAAVAATGLVHGVILKPLVGRGRPDPTRLPRGQRRRSSPSTSSFASGHSGAGTAFATVVGRGIPGSRGVVTVVALLVAYVQIFTGRHYLSDVVAGSALGIAIGALVDRGLRSLEREA